MTHYRIPNHILRTHGPAMGPYGIAVYNVLALHADAHGECYPRQSLIAHLTGSSPRKVRETLQHLVDLGLLHITQRGNGRSNLYRLLKIAAPDADQIQIAAPPAAQTPAPRATPHNIAAPRAAQPEIAAPHAAHNGRHVPQIAAPRAGPIKEQNPIEHDPSEKDGPFPYSEVEAFDAMLAELRQVVPKTTRDYTADLTYEGALENGSGELVFAVGITDHKARDWIQQRYARTMHRSLQSMFPQPIALEFITLEEAAP